jgi:predicted nucleic acid-binding protein
MRYLIDSDWFIDYLGGVADAVALIQLLTRDGFSISIITYIEVYQGAYRRQSLAAEQELALSLQNIPIIPVSISVAQRCARLREDLRQRGRRIRPRALDLIIAATALEHDLTLVTRNTDDYRDVPGIKVYQ